MGKGKYGAFRLTLLVGGMLAFSAGSASASTYIGPNPATGDPEHTQTILFSYPVVLFNVAGPAGQVLTAPSSGVITSWKLYTGEVKGAAATAQLRILKLKAGVEYEAIRSGPVQTVDEVSAVTANKSYMHEFKVSVPISVGETIGVGLRTVSSPSSYVIPALPAVEGQGWKYGCIGCSGPPLEEGQTGTAAVIEDQWVAMSAQIEPDANHNGLGDETQEPAGSAETLPGTAVKKKCKKGKKLKHGKCVKKKHRHKHHHSPRRI